ncbi:hypothetical protein L1887_37952 [Cichorium endivia]|nr:hypothetical protein L1887_37952 [Cichorium endivia]
MTATNREEYTMVTMIDWWYDDIYVSSIPDFSVRATREWNKDNICMLLSSDQAISNKLKTMGSGHHRQDGDKGLFSHLVGAGQYAPQVAYPYPPPVGYPPSGYHHHGGYPPHVCPPPGGYPPVGYPASSAPYYSGHGRHGHGVGTFIAGGAAAVAAAYGAHHMPHHNYGSHGYGYYGYHHGKYKHGKFKRAKFGKRWKRGWIYGKHKW